MSCVTALYGIRKKHTRLEREMEQALEDILMMAYILSRTIRFTVVDLHSLDLSDETLRPQVKALSELRSVLRFWSDLAHSVSVAMSFPQTGKIPQSGKIPARFGSLCCLMLPNSQECLLAVGWWTPDI